MNDHREIEASLKNFNHEPTGQVKQSVMSAYRNSFSREVGPRTGGLWRRPIPLYVAATALVVMIGVSFVAGKSISSRDTVPSAPAEIEWSVARNDLL